MTIPACPSLMCSSNRGNIEGTDSSKICVWCLCMFYVCKVIGFVDWLDRGLICMWEEFRNVYLLMTWVWLYWGDPVWLTGHQNPITTPTSTTFRADLNRPFLGWVWRLSKLTLNRIICLHLWTCPSAHHINTNGPPQYVPEVSGLELVALNAGDKSDVAVSSVAIHGGHAMRVMALHVCRHGGLHLNPPRLRPLVHIRCLVVAALLP